MTKITEIWKKTGLLEGIEDDLRKDFVANNLEITAKWLVKTARNPDKSVDHIELFSEMILLLIRNFSTKETFRVNLEMILDKLLEQFERNGKLIPEPLVKDNLIDEQQCYVDFYYHILKAFIRQANIEYYEHINFNSKE